MSDTTILQGGSALVDDSAFFAFQCAISSYPDDTLRNGLRKEILTVQQGATAEKVAQCVRQIMRDINANKSLIEYCVWDYTLVPTVATAEFREWVSGVREVREERDDEREELSFQEDRTVYCVFTLALRSRHPSLRNWLAYYPEHLQAEDYFKRKTLNALLERLSAAEAALIEQSSELLIELMPRNDDMFYSSVQLREDKDWDYLHPVY